LKDKTFKLAASRDFMIDELIGEPWNIDERLNNLINDLRNKMFGPIYQDKFRQNRLDSIKIIEETQEIDRATPYCKKVFYG